MSEKVYVFDTTLRDGEQCPGASMNIRQKMEIARQLARLRVDIIEAGFPVISEGDFESVSRISAEVAGTSPGGKGPVICGLSRCVPKDIEAAGKAIKPARKLGRIHVFLATSPIHRQYKFGKAEAEILRLAVEGTKRAKQLCQNIEFSPEDAARTEVNFLTEVVEAVIEAGATTVNIPDTVGYAMPEQFGAVIRHLRNRIGTRAIISVHCHNDLGLAVANSLAGVVNGARQVECTINGIGERAGNASLEECVMAIKTRHDYFKDVHTTLDTREIVKASRLVSRHTSFIVQRNKAIVGENAFAHSAGIHQDGILKKRETYEIMNPHDVGWGETELPLTKHSGRNALSRRLRHLGFKLSEDEINRVFVGFKKIGDAKKFVYDDDLIALVESEASVARETYTLEHLSFVGGTGAVPTATVRLRKGKEQKTEACTGDGPVDAALKTIDRITGKRGKLLDYQLRATTSGRDAVGEVTVKVQFGKEDPLVGRGASTDVIEASAKAYLNAVNRALASQQRGGKLRGV
ncbi:MAG: 2-isopropylmalate synthase [Verrucomicrobia bacterium]|nr:2-isopropylmalate synthase [Verrucomicrobiota bacterium]